MHQYLITHHHGWGKKKNAVNLILTLVKNVIRNKNVLHSFILILSAGFHRRPAPTARARRTPRGRSPCGTRSS
eukprot:2770867-Prymnesium_polylepis.1